MLGNYVSGICILLNLLCVILRAKLGILSSREEWHVTQSAAKWKSGGWNVIKHQGTWHCGSNECHRRWEEGWDLKWILKVVKTMGSNVMKSRDILFLWGKKWCSPRMVPNTITLESVLTWLDKTSQEKELWYTGYWYKMSSHSIMSV